MKIPNKLSLDPRISGTELKRAINMLIDAVKANVLRGDSKTVKVNTTPSGSTISVIKGSTPNSGGSGSAIRWAKIKTIIDNNIYTSDIYYGRHTNSSPVFEDVDFYVFDIVRPLKAGDWVPAIQYPYGNPTAEPSEETTEWVCPQQLGAVG